MRGFEVVSKYKDRVKELPKRATVSSAGYDIRVLTEDEKPVKIYPGERVTFATGLKAYMDKDEVLQIYVRSSIGMKKGLVLTNSVGIVDSDYYNNPDNEGHISVGLLNTSDKPQVVENNERVAQGIFTKFLVADNDSATEIRTGGIGSTNEKK